MRREECVTSGRDKMSRARRSEHSTTSDDCSPRSREFNSVTSGRSRLYFSGLWSDAQPMATVAAAVKAMAVKDLRSECMNRLLDRLRIVLLPFCVGKRG